MNKEDHFCLHDEEWGKLMEVSERNVKNIDKLYEWRDATMSTIATEMGKKQVWGMIFNGVCMCSTMMIAVINILCR